MVLPSALPSLAGWASDFGHSHLSWLDGGVYKAREHIHRGMLIRDY